MNKAFDSLMDQARAQVPKPKSHPNLEDLATLAREKEPAETDPAETDPAETDPILDHLADCRDCADLVLAMRQDAQGNPCAQETGGDETNHAWERFQARLEKPPETLGLAEQESNPAPRRKPLWARLWFAYGLAALLLVGLMVSHFRGSGIRTQVTAVNLKPLKNQRITRGIPEEKENQVRGNLVVTLSFPGDVEYHHYRVKIREASSAKTVFEDGIWRQEDKIFVFTIDKGTLPAGEYRLTLSGRNNGTWFEMAEYELSIPLL